MYPSFYYCIVHGVNISVNFIVFVFLYVSYYAKEFYHFDLLSENNKWKGYTILIFTEWGKNFPTVCIKLFLPVMQLKCIIKWL